jgi:hypothetical protein
MRTSKKTIVSLLPLLVLGLVAVVGAAEKPEIDHGPTVIVPSAPEGSRATGDDCTDPILIGSLPYSDLGQTNCGRLNTYSNTCLGSYDGGEDIMYRLDVTSSMAVDIVMDPLGTGWTGILIDDSCPPDPVTCIAKNTGSSGVRSMFGVALMPGSYYIMVDTWPSPTCIPAFNLTITEAIPYPNPTCGTAIDLQDQSLISFQVNTCGGGNDYSPTNLCTGYSQANGDDAVYSIYLTAGETIAVTLTGENYDAAIYLLTDCSDMNSCVAGGDDPETFVYEAVASGVYYLIIDGYAAGGCGTSTVTIDAPVSSTPSTFGQIKSTFR